MALIDERGELKLQSVMSKLASRFDATELSAAAFARFQQSSQRESERAIWGDRVLAPSYKAVPDIPDHHTNTRVATHDCLDKESGHFDCTRQPQTIDKAIEDIEWYTVYPMGAKPYGGRNRSGGRYKTSDYRCAEFLKVMAKRHRPVDSEYQIVSETFGSVTDDDVQLKVVRSRLKPHRSSQSLRRRESAKLSLAPTGG